MRDNGTMAWLGRGTGGVAAGVLTLLAASAGAAPADGVDVIMPPASASTIDPAARPTEPAWRRAGFPSFTAYALAARANATCRIDLPEGAPTEGGYVANRWPDGIVPYTIDDGVSPPSVERIETILAELMSVSGLIFVERRSETDYVTFRPSTVNSSSIGRIGGQQFINIAQFTFEYIIAHETIHALGWWHEHQRPDRNDFIQINSGNIIPGAGSQFAIPGGTVPFGAFDLDSVMHYGQCAFSNCECPGCPTITVLPPNEAWQDLIGQRDHLSDGDIAMLAGLYPGVPDDIYEPNDVAADAAPIGLGTHVLQMVDSDDYFELTVAEATALIVDLSFDAPDLDIDIVLSQVGGSVVGFDFGSGPTRQIIGVVAPGTYQLHALREFGLAEEYELTFTGPATECQVAVTGGDDCNDNGIDDVCDLATGVLTDADGDGVPDECAAACVGDVDGSGAVDFNDVLGVLGDWGPCPGCPGDLDGSDVVDFNDLLTVLGDWACGG